MILSVRRLTFLTCLLSVIGLDAQTTRDPVVSVSPMVVEAPLLTESPATVSHIDLTNVPLTENSIRGLSDLAANFFVSSNDVHSFNDTFALRGLTNTPIFGGPAISFYLDDLPLGSSFTFPTDLVGFTKAELHRGPSQNTVFGRAGSAGVITLTIPEPSTDVSGEIRASMGNYRARNISLHESTAAGTNSDGYLSLAYATRDGYITNTRLNRDIDDKESFSGLARFRFRPTTVSEFTFLVTGLRARDGVQPLVPLGGPLFTVNRSKEGQTSLDAYNGLFKAAFATSIGQLSATTSFNSWDLGPYSNVLAFGPSELSNAVGQKQRNWNEEIKLVANSVANLRWQSGLFYSDGRTDGDFTRSFGPFVYEKSIYRVHSRDAAIFGEATLKINSSFRLTAGLRGEDSRKKLDRTEAVPAPQVFNLTRESSALLPKFGASYDLDHETNVFATLGAGYKPGGFSAFTGNRSLAAFGAERTKTIEAGVTRTAANRLWSATVRGFWYDITGYQIERSFATSAVADDYLVVNAPRARSYGAETELSWHPFSGLTLAADLGTTNVTLREFRDPYTGIRYDGKRAPFVPVYDASLRAEYQHSSGWFGGVDVTSNGKTYYTEAEDPTFEQKSFVLLGAQAGYATGPYRFRLYGENLTDKGYYSAITAGTGHGTPGAPLTFGFEVTGKW